MQGKSIYSFFGCFFSVFHDHASEKRFSQKGWRRPGSQPVCKKALQQPLVIRTTREDKKKARWYRGTSNAPLGVYDHQRREKGKTVKKSSYSFHPPFPLFKLEKGEACPRHNLSEHGSASKQKDKPASACVRACVYKEKGSFFLPSAPTIICPDLLSIWPFETHLLPRTIKLNGRRRTQEDLLSECSCEEEDLVCLAFFPFFLVHHPWDQWAKGEWTQCMFLLSAVKGIRGLIVQKYPIVHGAQTDREKYYLFLWFLLH